jgi:hypothetical protein
MGTASTCAIRVRDSLVSRVHARLVWDGARWCISDCSKNGLYLDDIYNDKAFLYPGVRIRIGRLTLVAESDRTIALREALARMMGWGPELMDAHDAALQRLRDAVVGKAVFMICGDGDLLGFAQELHELAMGGECPIVYCKPGGGRSQPPSGFEPEPEENPSIQRVASGREAISLAQGGTICIDNRRLPMDLDSILERTSPAPILVIVLARYTRKTEVFTRTPMVIPPLSARQHELDRLMVECEGIASLRLGCGLLTLTSAQRNWVRDHCETLAEFQLSVLRLIALRHAGSVPGAAELLRLSASGLRQWYAARGLATD